MELVVARLSEDVVAAPAASVDASAEASQLEIGPDWRWVRVAGGDKSSLLRRHAGRGILQCLVRHHAERPGHPVDRQTLIDAGWPGERMLQESALALFHTTMWRLRQMGLAGLLTTDGDGYALEADTVVTFVDA